MWAAERAANKKPHDNEECQREGRTGMTEGRGNTVIHTQSGDRDRELG